jgi:hypothetical protein
MASQPRLLFVTFILLPIIFTTAHAEGLTNDPVSRFIMQGEFHGQFGVATHYEDSGDHHNFTNNGSCWGLVELQYTTPALYGFRAGTWLVGAHEIWEDHSGNYQIHFTEDSSLRNLFVEYAPSFSLSTVTVGRAGFVNNPTMNGDAHQGAALHFNDIPHLNLQACAISRWVHHATTLFTADGIDEWQEVDDVYDEAGGVFVGGAANITWGDQLLVSPFISWQDKIMTVYGCSLAVSNRLNEEWSWGVNGTYALYENHAPTELFPDYEDVQSWLLHGAMAWREGSFGLGWYGVSDDQGNLTASMFNTFDPMQDGNLFPLNDENDASLFYADANWTYQSFRLKTLLGIGKNHAVDSRATEFDLWLYYNVTPSLLLSGYLVRTDYSNDDIADYTKTGASVTYVF